MTKRELVRRVIAHEDVGMAPYNIYFTEQEHDKLRAYTGLADYQSQVGNYVEMCTYAIEAAPAGRPGFVKDNFGVIWNRTGADKDIGAMENIQITDRESFERYVFPKPDEKAIRRHIEHFFENTPDVFRFGAIGFSMFERAWTLMGMENLLICMISEPELVHDLLDKIRAFDNQVMDIMLDYPFDGFHFGDDWGQQRGLIMGPAHWREFIKPQMRRLYARVREKGMVVSQHSCGDLREVLDDLIEIGLDVYQTFQPEIYDIAYEKETHGQKLTFWGGVSTQTLLPSASPEEVRRETRRILETMRRNGGFIASPTHSVPGDVPPENILALTDVFHEQDIYRT